MLSLTIAMTVALALRIIPGSHASPLHDILHAAHQRAGGPGHTTEGIAAELGCQREEDVPCHVCATEPGDVIVFDQGCFHAAFGGAAGRRMCSAVFYLVPRNETEDAALRARAVVNNAAYYEPSRRFQRRGYDANWIANDGHSERRAKWISCLRRYGFDLAG